MVLAPAAFGGLHSQLSNAGWTGSTLWRQVKRDDLPFDRLLHAVLGVHGDMRHIPVGFLARVDCIACVGLLGHRLARETSRACIVTHLLQAVMPLNSHIVMHTHRASLNLLEVRHIHIVTLNTGE